MFFTDKLRNGFNNSLQKPLKNPYNSTTNIEYIKHVDELIVQNLLYQLILYDCLWNIVSPIFFARDTIDGPRATVENSFLWEETTTTWHL